MDIKECIYFAYGSNLHPLRLQARVPSARLLGVSCLPSHQMVFGKRGMDGSGKCTTMPGKTVKDTVPGALFALRRDEINHLDAAEGPAYLRKTAFFALDGSRFSGFYYEAREYSLGSELRPFDWYRDLVVAGARFHALPEHYVSALARVPTRQDANQERVARIQSLLARMSGS